MSTQPTGYLLHTGEVAGRAYVVIATLETANRKTGDMIQIWFLLRDTHPVEAVQTGVDGWTICQGCAFSIG